MSVEQQSGSDSSESSSSISIETDGKYAPKWEMDGRMICVGKTLLDPELPTLDEAFLEWKKRFWENKVAVDGIRNIVAPMVDQSELAFRILLRRHGAHLAFTPMIHAQLFVSNWTYRRQALATIPEDRPLIVQFCANDADVLLAACRLVEGYCDGVDLNLGCPQIVAKRGHYGSFLQERPKLIEQMISTVHKHCKLPLSVKIRCLNTDEATVEYAKMCERAGASMLTIHGRRRDQKGVETGVADWSMITKVVEALKIPVIANGNIQMPGDVKRCIEHTGAHAVMSAEGILSNPYLFEETLRPGYISAKEYLELAEEFKPSTAIIRAHIFRMCHYSFLRYTDLREKNSYVMALSEFREIVDEIQRRCEEENEIVEYESLSINHNDMFVNRIASIPYYFAKPYVRPGQNSNDQSENDYRQNRRIEMEKIHNETGLSYRQIRKRERRRIDMKKEFARKQAFPVCRRCNQPAGVNCENEKCRKCCRFVCVRQGKHCKIHRFTKENLREKRLHFADQNGLSLEQVECNNYNLPSKSALLSESSADTLTAAEEVSS